MATRSFNQVMKLSLPIDLVRKRRRFRYSDQWFRKNVIFDRITPK